MRSGIYGSFLSGGLAGHFYGAEGIWGTDIEPGSDPFMWQSFQWNSANQMQYLKTFALCEGSRYQDLVPDANLVSPNATHETKGFTGWAYCARTADKTFFLAYFEKDCPNHSRIREAIPWATYRADWFNPRTGQWTAGGKLKDNWWGWIDLPEFPSDDDWGLKLVAIPEGFLRPRHGDTRAPAGCRAWGGIPASGSCRGLPHGGCREYARQGR